MEGEEQNPALWHTPGLDHSAGVWEAGYCYGRAFWGKGYATEALCAVRDFCVFGRWKGMDRLLSRGEKPRQRQSNGKSRLGVGSSTASTTNSTARRWTAGAM